MSMTRKRAIEVLVGRHREALAQSTNFRCCCCEGIFPRKEAGHVGAYISQSDIMRKLVPGENMASFVLCQECARMPEKMSLMKVEQYLVKNGILRRDLKPLDAPGGHSPGHQHRHGPNCSHGKGGNLFPGRG